MVDHDDDDVFELTEDMTTIPPPSEVAEEGKDDESSEEDQRGDSQPPPRSSSPFLMVADPKPPESHDEPRTNTAQDSKPRPSYVPEKSDTPVIAMPIHNLTQASMSVPAKDDPVDEPMLELKEENVADEPADDVDDVEDTVDDEQVLELGQEMMVEEEESEAKGEEYQGSSEAVFDDSPQEKDKEDHGSPDAVFDETIQEIEEEIDVDVAETEEPREADSDEAEEEIDLDEAEEMTDSARMPVPPAARVSGGRTPRIRRRRKRPREWWSDIFDDDYLSLLPASAARDTRREVDFIEKNLSVNKESLILDLACGNGRHAVGMSRRGYRIVGVDLSLPMLARAGEAAQEADQKINFIHGDMRDLGFDQTFDGIYCVGTSFGYFDEPTNQKVLEGVAKALKPGAPFLLEVANRDHAIADQPNLTWFEGDGSVCMEETNFNFINSRLYVARQLIMGESGRQVKHELSIRLYSLHELGMMLHKAGLAVSQVAGHSATPGAFFGADSAYIIILASRRK
ncbi:MAG: class I SAM-dependent methyltransferase [Deltaproteobacteria bacterium]|nr:class I SAM-dependent methyltransferase [Deltaproteobacteria bacterium]